MKLIRDARARRAGPRGRQTTAATGLAGSTRLWKVGHGRARVGWGKGFDKKPQAEGTGLNNQGWALASPGNPVFTHLGSATASWSLPRLLCSARFCHRRTCRVSPQDCFFACTTLGPARESLKKREIRRGGRWAWGRRGRSGEAGTRSAGGITRPLARGGSTSAKRWGSFAGV